MGRTAPLSLLGPNASWVQDKSTRLQIRGRSRAIVSDACSIALDSWAAPPNVCRVAASQRWRWGAGGSSRWGTLVAAGVLTVSYLRCYTQKQCRRSDTSRQAGERAALSEGEPSRSAPVPLDGPKTAKSSWMMMIPSFRSERCGRCCGTPMASPAAPSSMPPAIPAEKCRTQMIPLR